jgi:hypothetical protein
MLPEADVRVSEFSALVDGARDHVQLRVGAGLTASYVVGDHELLVVYGKLGGAVPRALVEHVEQRLGAVFGPICWDADSPGVPRPW